RRKEMMVIRGRMAKEKVSLPLVLGKLRASRMVELVLVLPVGAIVRQAREVEADFMVARGIRGRGALVARVVLVHLYVEGAIIDILGNVVRVAVDVIIVAR
ncbi:hypothetical protein, partial [Streptococcus uberis]|uniref:hypothetical protein n=1 Tax=Streptococcus uberis TaxID=1349 RepID=UPI003D6A777B